MKLSIKQKARNLLASAGLRITVPRLAVLEVLLRARKPQTANQIGIKLGGTSPNKVTIYRVLESLLEAGLVHKVFLRQRAWHFEPADNCTETQCHPHFTCTSCEKTHCLTEITLPMAKTPHKGFAIRHQRVQLEGLCPKCNV